MPTRMEVTIGGEMRPRSGRKPMGMPMGMPMGKPMSMPGACPTGGCSTAYGPVANICQSSFPVTQLVPVTTQVPVTTVTPIPNMVMPQVSKGMPMGGTYGMGPMAMGGGMPFGKGAMPMPAPVPGMMPGIYTTEAWITGV